jgi:hypothetical protein
MGDEGGGLELFKQRAEVAVVHRRAALGIDDAAFRLDDFRVEAQIADAVGLHVEHEVERGAGKPVRVDGDVLAGVGVVVSAVLLHFDVELLGSILLGSVEHHVFEEVRDPGDAGPLVARSDFVEEIQRDVGDVVVLLDENLHAVGERVCLDIGLLGDEGDGEEVGNQEPHEGTIAERALDCVQF